MRLVAAPEPLAEVELAGEVVEIPPLEAQVLPGLLDPDLGFQILSRYVLTFEQAQGLVHFGLPGGAGPPLVESIAPEERK
jgi:hypothetical protein